MATTTIMRRGVGTVTVDKVGRIKEVVAPFEATTDPIVEPVPAAVVPPRGKYKNYRPVNSQFSAWTAVELIIIHLATTVVIMIRGTIISTSLIFTRPIMLMAVPIITKRLVVWVERGINVILVGTECRRVATPRVCDRLPGN